FPRRKKTWSLIHILVDILFWMMQGLIVFFVLLEVNRGVVRIPILLVLLCGYGAYRALFQSLTIRMLDGAIRMGSSFFRFLRKTVDFILIQPIKWLLQLLVSFGKILSSLIIRVFLFIVKMIWIPLKWLVPDAVWQRLSQ